MIAAALGLGLLIGGFLGALGGGGAILTVPALIYLLDQTAQDATTSSLIIVGAASVTGVIGYARGRHVQWRLGILFGIAGTAAAFGGTALNRMVDQQWLLIGFAGVMVLAAAGMLIRSRSADIEQPPAAAAAPIQRSGTAHPAAPLPRSALGTQTSPIANTAQRGHRWSWASVGQILLAGMGVGFLTGFFGVGGGFVIVPVLVLLFNLPMSAAAATSLLIIIINSTASLIARTGHANFDWAIIIPFAVAAMLASLAGKTIAGKLPEIALTRIFAGMLIAIALFVATQNILELAS